MNFFKMLQVEKVYNWGQLLHLIHARLILQGKELSVTCIQLYIYIHTHTILSIKYQSETDFQELAMNLFYERIPMDLLMEF